MFAVIKCFATDRKRKVNTTELQNLNLEEEDAYQYWSFEPKDSTDFVEKKYYGIIAKQNMTLCFIMAMHGK